jgi:hypothetical protein
LNVVQEWPIYDYFNSSLDTVTPALTVAGDKAAQTTNPHLLVLQANWLLIFVGILQR